MIEELILEHHQKQVDKCIAEAEQHVSYLMNRQVKLLMVFQETTLEPETIMYLVCQEFDVTVEDILDKDRKIAKVAARQMYCYLCRELLNRKMQELAKDIHRDHTTVILAIRQVRNYLYIKDELVLGSYNRIMERIENEA